VKACWPAGHPPRGKVPSSVPTIVERRVGFGN